MQVVRKLLRITIPVIALAWLGTARGAFLSPNPVADGWIQEFLPDKNNGGGPDVVAGTLGNTGQREIRRALLQFDLSDIPPGATINSVTLTVTVTRAPLSGRADSQFQLRR